MIIFKILYSLFFDNKIADAEARLYFGDDYESEED